MRFFMLLITLAASAQAEMSLTVYNQDLAVVRERRPFDLHEGKQVLRYSGVAGRLDPTSVHLDGDGIQLLEQDFDYDLINSDRLLEKHLDQTVKASLKGGPVIEGSLLSFDSGQLVLRTAKDGTLAMLNRAELADLEFSGLPNGLATRPSLVWTVESASGGKRPLTLTYMTAGMSWHAEYVATLSRDEKTLGLDGWVSLDNRSGATYEDATLKLVAGDVHRVRGDEDARQTRMYAANAMLAKPQVQERGFFDYHLYTIQRPVTLRDFQVKQIELLSAPGIPVKKSYTFDGEQAGAEVAVTLEFKNEAAQSLGMPFPAGTVRVFKADGNNGSEFVGEDSIKHTPKDETVRLKVGSSFDVVGERQVLEETPNEKARTTLRRVGVDLRNHGREAVTVIVLEHANGRWDVESDRKYQRKDATSFEFEVPVGPGESVHVEYQVRMRW